MFLPPRGWKTKGGGGGGKIDTGRLGDGRHVGGGRFRDFWVMYGNAVNVPALLLRGGEIEKARDYRAWIFTRLDTTHEELVPEYFGYLSRVRGARCSSWKLFTMAIFPLCWWKLFTSKELAWLQIFVGTRLLAAYSKRTYQTQVKLVNSIGRLTTKPRIDGSNAVART